MIKPVSYTHLPMYEEFRMLSFINNIKIQTPNDSALRPLSAEERELITVSYTHLTQ